MQIIFARMFRSLAQIALYRFQPTVVAITGNVGKTTTKDVVMAILSTQRTVGGTIRSQNSDLSTPLSILGLEVQSKERNPLVWATLLVRGVSRALLSRTFPEILVLEVGAGAPGDITRQAQWLRPHISVFTALQKYPVHLEFFPSRAGLFQEKKELARYTRPGGTIVYSRDDEFLHDLLGDCPQHKITTGERGDISCRDVINTHTGVEAVITVRGSQHQARLDGVWGTSYMTSYALGMAVASDLGLDVSECFTRTMEYFSPNPGRMRILQGIGGSLVVDDSYNASPLSVHAALDTLHTISMPGRKIFLFGDMKELGEHSHTAHREIGRQAVGVVDMIVLTGSEVEYTKAEMIDRGFESNNILEFPTSQEMGAFVATILRSGDIVLAKSSRHAIRMEQALEQLVTREERINLVQEYL